MREDEEQSPGLCCLPSSQGSHPTNYSGYAHGRSSIPKWICGSAVRFIPKEDEQSHLRAQLDRRKSYSNPANGSPGWQRYTSRWYSHLQLPLCGGVPRPSRKGSGRFYRACPELSAISLKIYFVDGDFSVLPYGQHGHRLTYEELQTSLLPTWSRQLAWSKHGQLSAVE